MPFPPDDASAGAVLTIDLAALVANWRALATRAGPAQCAAVVKADAYGTGQDRAVRALAAAGCRSFFVAHPGEAVRARHAAGPGADIFVLNGFALGAEEHYRTHRLRPVLGSLGEAVRWASFAGAGADLAAAALHLDTGMNRLGLSPDEALPWLAGTTPPPFAIALLMSHLVAAEVAEDPINARQLAAFTALRAHLPRIPASLANSSGIFLGGAYGFDLVRPGYGLYGGNPTPGAANPMRPVVRLEASVIRCRDVEAGATVGYNGQWTAKRPSRLATIGIGYADGYPRQASATDARAGGSALVAGRLCPFAGRVSMDLIVLDITEVPRTEVAEGTIAELLGPTITVDDAGGFARTSGYEILTNLGDRYRRVYLT